MFYNGSDKIRCEYKEQKYQFNKDLNMKYLINKLALFKQWILSIVSNSALSEREIWVNKVKIAKEKIKYTTSYFTNEEMIFIDNYDEIIKILGIKDNLSGAMFIKFQITKDSIDECVDFLIENAS